MAPSTAKPAQVQSAVAHQAATTHPFVPGTTGQKLLDHIGNTPLLRLERVLRDAPGAELLGKAEWYNPGGSVKDRAAANILREARASGN